MLKHALRTLGKSVVIVSAVGFGIVKALDAFAPKTPEVQHNSDVPQENRQPMRDAAAINRLETRLNSMEERLIRIEHSLSSIAIPAEPEPPCVASEEPRFVTQAELTATLDRHSRDLDSDIERRFELQNRAVQSLRTMVARTDELLERVIENIESMSVNA